ncbi:MULTISPECIES: cysteine hydrolase family protein [unclassified Methylobacterium]|jgi:nicotinamidase-related amidase|uniref:cysteine hydrolase family protein n=1 Tax=unclassified Methylobacterium TaxID=2615210 RepID=UPI0013547193|nr:cysteine hydrolase family protein [Methylobacterium sp. 2A]MWV22366.1 cysteine hydrolase [Methylobacterium sp. 2A]
MSTHERTAPQTLLGFADAPTHPSALASAALVLIDIQDEYVGGSLPLSGVEDAVAEARTLLDAARAAGTPVFHIVHHGKPGGRLFDPEGPHAAIVPALRPAEGEAIIAKSLPNSFAKTDLHDRITATGRKELIVAGFQTHLCVSATVRAALDLGYRTTLVEAATATRDLPDPLGGVLAADAIHRATIAALADRFAIVVRRTEQLAA